MTSNVINKVGQTLKNGAENILKEGMKRTETCKGGKEVFTIQGKEYKWCNCPQTTQSPMCDNYSCYLFKPGFQSLPNLGIKIKETGGVKNYCNCKNTSTPPYCDNKGYIYQNVEDDLKKQLP